VASRGADESFSDRRLKPGQGSGSAAVARIEGLASMNDMVSEDGLEALIKAGMSPQSRKRLEGGWEESSKPQAA
jgi:hypothetical protein